MLNFKEQDYAEAGRLFCELLHIMSRLRGEQGCPWDQKQDHRSIKPCLIEETYEVVEAIEEGSAVKLTEELGDVLLQVVFHAQIGKDEQTFQITDVIKTLNEKLVRRHPHVFADVQLDTAEAVLANWEAIKKKEKGEQQDSSLLQGIPKNIPGLLRAHRIQERVARVGFDWERIDGLFAKIDEELEEFKAAYREGGEEEINDELGDLFFMLVNLARFVEKDPESALHSTINKFVKRFNYIERALLEKGVGLEEASLEVMEELWQEAKGRLTA